jgi:hypothetical protein
MKTKNSPLNFSVYGQLVDRYLFNFRINPDSLAVHLPQVEWLKPRIVHGHGIVSFCLLKLKGLTVWPLPSFLGFNSTSSAYRCAVMDSSGGSPEPSVYVLGRNTDLPLISRLGPVLFSGKMQMIHTRIEQLASSVDINANFMDGRTLFSAQIRQSEKDKFESELFDSVEEFVNFIKGGASSYTPGTQSGHYSRVDLEEDSNFYEPVDAAITNNWIESDWKDAGLVLDSAFHAGGGRYKLKYLGSVAGETKKNLYTSQIEVRPVK